MEKHGKVGRPSKITEEAIRKIEEVAALDGSIEEMAFYAGVHRATLYRYLDENEDFRDRIEDLRQRPILLARQTIVKNLEQPHHAQWYLSRKKKKEFAERIENTGADGEAIKVEDSSKIQELTAKLNELYRTGSITGDGRSTDSVGTKTPDKE